MLEILRDIVFFNWFECPAAIQVGEKLILFLYLGNVSTQMSISVGKN